MSHASLASTPPAGPKWGHEIKHDGYRAVFDALHGQRRLREAFLYAFDLIEMDGEDLRHCAFSERKTRLERLLAGRNAGMVLNQHVVEKGAVVFAARLDAPYRFGRSRDWIKTKNPA